MSDSREGRKYSEITSSQLHNLPRRIFQCSQCGRLFEEKSRFCPFCSKKGLPKKTMGELKQIPQEWIERGKQREIERLKNKWG